MDFCGRIYGASHFSFIREDHVRLFLFADGELVHRLDIELRQAVGFPLASATAARLAGAFPFLSVLFSSDAEDVSRAKPEEDSQCATLSFRMSKFC